MAGSLAFGLAAGRNAFLAGGQNLVPVPEIDGLIARATPLTGVTSAVGANSSFANFNGRRATVNGLIDALAEEGVVTVLAHPTLTAESGQVASFLAGGEFPVPAAQTGSVAAGGVAPPTTLQFKPFRGRVHFAPTVLSRLPVSLKMPPG